MSPKNKVLGRGDIILLNFDPQAGSEITKRRPALVVSPDAYNQKSSLILCCPITSTIRNHPWEVLLLDTHEVTGAILSNQVSSMDQHARKAKWLCKVSSHIVHEVLSKIQTLVI